MCVCMCVRGVGQWRCVLGQDQSCYSILCPLLLLHTHTDTHTDTWRGISQFIRALFTAMSLLYGLSDTTQGVLIARAVKTMGTRWVTHTSYMLDWSACGVRGTRSVHQSVSCLLHTWPNIHRCIPKHILSASNCTLHKFDFQKPQIL